MKGNDNKNELVFFVMSLSHPRCIKRVAAFRDAGYHCIVYGYRRGLYDVNEYPDGIEVHLLGEVKNRDYKNNFWRVKKDVAKVLHQHGSKTRYYAFGFTPSLFFAIKGAHFIYECSDIRYAIPKFNKIRWLFKLIDRWLIRKSRVTVMTSGGFAVFFGAEKNEKVVILPNRVSPSLSTVVRKSLSASEHLSFGFVGLIRYWNILRFAEVIGNDFPEYSFHFFGAVDPVYSKKFEIITAKIPNVIYHGKFRSPEDLADIYRHLDLIVACYDNATLNVQIAEPNKLYESLLFCKPIIVSSNTYLSRRVQQFGCGYVIDANEYDSVKAFIANLRIDDINRVSGNELAISLSEIIDDPSALLEKVSSL